MLERLARCLPGRHLPHTPREIAFQHIWPGTHRGLMAWGLALYVGLKGLGYLVLGAPIGSDQSLAFLSTLGFPIRAAGALTLLFAVYAALMAYCHHGRDRYSFIAITVTCGGWGALYLVTPLVLGEGSWGTAWQGTTSWWGYALVSILCAAYAEPVDPERTCKAPPR